MHPKHVAQCWTSKHLKCKMLSNLYKWKVKSRAKYFLALVFGICSLWLVWDHCSKFLSDSTTVVRQQQQNDYLPLPRLMLCNNERYNEKELEAMNLPEDFFDNRHPDISKLKERNSFPNLNDTWQRATWPKNEIQIDWNRYEGEREVDSTV